MFTLNLNPCSFLRPLLSLYTNSLLSLRFLRLFLHSFHSVLHHTAHGWRWLASDLNLNNKWQNACAGIAAMVRSAHATIKASPDDAWSCLATVMRRYQDSSVPVNYYSWIERVSCWLTHGPYRPILKRVTSGGSGWLFKADWWHCNKFMGDVVHEGEPLLSSTLTKRFPLEICQEGRYAHVPLAPQPIVCHSCGMPIYPLQGIHVLLLVGIPNTGTLLQFGPNQGGLGQGSSVSGAIPQVPGNHM